MEASAFSPSHITGFFEVVDQPPELALRGSRGAGVSLSKGVRTYVRIRESPKPRLEVIANGKSLGSARLTRCVIDRFLPKRDRNYSVLVNQDIQVPMGSGFGSSGACALSLSLAINEALGLGLSKEEATRIAHIAEIECKTGLGTVLAETYGGFEVRIKAGAPGIGETKRIPIANDYLVVSLCLGPISTRMMLNDKNLCNRINEAGKGLTDSLLEEPSPRNFMTLSRKFANSLDVFTDRLKMVLDEADANGFICSMAMIGESIFSIVKTGEVEELANIFHKYERSDKDVIVSSIDRRGARLL
ncbi:MAG: pantoate kinase [Nitrososphaerales archaeon]